MSNQPSHMRLPIAGARVVLRIGITGHRSIAAHKKEAIKSVCRVVIERSRSAVAAMLDATYTGYSAELPLVRVVSALADGSDQILVEAAQEFRGLDGPAVETWAILPFPASLYRLDFKQADVDLAPQNRFDELLATVDHCTTLDGDRSDLSRRLEAYDQAGRLMLAGCDVLVSISSPDAPPKQGGSVLLTQSALKNGTLVVTLDPGTPAEVFLKGIDAEEHLWQERFDPNNFEQRLIGILRPPTDEGWQVADSRWPEMRNRIIQVPNPDRFERLMAHLYRVPWSLLRTVSMPKDKRELSTTDRPETPLKQRYEKAERLSQHYAILWRGSFMLNYILGAAAVTCALLQYATQSEGHSWTWGEAIALSLLLGNYWIGRARSWHASFAELRFFAEQLRQARALSMIGAMIPQLHIAGAGAEPGRDAWINWYCRALQRSYLPIEAQLSAKYAWTLKGWVSKQRSYHAEYGQTREAMERSLKLGELVLFICACLACVMHLVGRLPVSVEPWLVFLAAAAPAWAAVLHAISVEGEFKMVAEASKSTARRLKSIDEKASQALQDGSASHAELIETARKAAMVMMEEAAGWRSVSQMHQMLPS